MEVEDCTEWRQNPGEGEGGIPPEDVEMYNKLSDDVENFWREPDGDSYLSMIQTIVNFLITKDHVWCRYPNITPEVIILFKESNLRDVPSVRNIADKFFPQLNVCTKCVDKFHYGKRTMVEKFESKLPMQEYMEMLETVKKINISRIEKYYSELIPQKPKDGEDPKPPVTKELVIDSAFLANIRVPLYETLKYSEVFTCHSEIIEKSLFEALKHAEVIKNKSMVTMWRTECLPGLFYYLLFHPDTPAIPRLSLVINEYVMKDGTHTKLLGNTYYDILKPIISQAADIMNRDDFAWLAELRHIPVNGVKVQTWGLFYKFMNVFF